MNAAAGPDRVADWLRFGTDGQVEILSGKVELGQGVHDALAMIVAEELDLPHERVRVLPVDTAVSRDEGLTAGSRTIEESGAALRAVAASARAALLGLAAIELNVRPADLAIDAGAVLAPDGRRRTYAELDADGAVGRAAVDPAASPKAAHRRRLVGTSPPRRDLSPKVTGAPAFLQDLVLPGMLHGRVVRPPAPGARLESFDRARALDLPGVVAVAVDGDFVGIVAAREDQAVAARDRVARTVVWTAAPSSPDLSDPRYLLRLPSEELLVDERGRPDIPRDPIARTVAAEYSRPHLAHAAIGPSCAVALLEHGHLDAWSHSQGIFRLRHELALVLGLDERDVRVRHLEGAGCYGHNGADDAALDAALMARAVPGRPVRVQWSREDEFGWEPLGPAMVVRLEADLAADGTIVDWRHDLWGHGHETRPSQGGRPPDQSALLAARHLARPFVAARPRRPRGPTSGGQRNSVPPYAFARRRIVDHFVADAPLRVSSLRALGAHANVFAIESFIDEIAAAAGQDPVAVRLRYLDDPRARAVIERAVSVAGPRPAREGPGETLHGRGLAFSRYKNRAAYAAVVVDVELDIAVHVRRAVGAIDAGMVVSLDGLRNQAEGGIVQAVSWTLHEAVTVGDGGVTSLDWDRYPILRFPDAPEIEIAVIDRPDAPSLGAGEAMAGPTSAAIANAIADATGVRLRDLPFRGDRVREALAR